MDDGHSYIRETIALQPTQPGDVYPSRAELRVLSIAVGQALT